jgi:hypothetical protein
MHDFRGNIPLVGCERKTGMPTVKIPVTVHLIPGINIDPDKVRRFHLFPIGRWDCISKTANGFRCRVIIAAKNQAVKDDIEGEAPAIRRKVKACMVSSVNVFRSICTRIAEPAAWNNTDLNIFTCCSLDPPLGFAVGESKDMIDLGKLFVTEIEARCVYSAAITSSILARSSLLM